MSYLQAGPNDGTSASSQAYSSAIHPTGADTGSLGTMTVEMALDPVTTTPSPANKGLPPTPDFSAVMAEYTDTLDISRTEQTPSSALPRETAGHPGTREISRRPSSAKELCLQSRSPTGPEVLPELEFSVPPPVPWQRRAADAWNWVADSLTGRCSKTRTACAWAAVGLVGAGAIASGVGLAMLGVGVTMAAAWAAFFVSAGVVTAAATAVGGWFGYRRGRPNVSPDFLWAVGTLQGRYKQFEQSDWDCADAALKVHRKCFHSPLPPDPHLGDDKDLISNYEEVTAPEEVLWYMNIVKSVDNASPKEFKQVYDNTLRDVARHIYDNGRPDDLCLVAAMLTMGALHHTYATGRSVLDTDNLRSSQQSLIESSSKKLSIPKTTQNGQDPLLPIFKNRSTFCELYSTLVMLAEQNKGNEYGQAISDVQYSLRLTALQMGTKLERETDVEKRLDELERWPSCDGEEFKEMAVVIRRQIPSQVTARVMLGRRKLE